VADHYVALNQGVTGTKYNDFITGTATTAGTNQIELRIQDGTTMSRKEVLLALEAFERFFENSQQVVTAGFNLP
jgi:hypothetical protein